MKQTNKKILLSSLLASMLITPVLSQANSSEKTIHTYVEDSFGEYDLERVKKYGPAEKTINFNSEELKKTYIIKPIKTPPTTYVSLGLSTSMLKSNANGVDNSLSISPVIRIGKYLSKNISIEAELGGSGSSITNDNGNKIESDIYGGLFAGLIYPSKNFSYFAKLGVSKGEFILYTPSHSKRITAKEGFAYGVGLNFHLDKKSDIVAEGIQLFDNDDISSQAINVSFMLKF